jgi:hypothetical protein
VGLGSQRCCRSSFVCSFRLVCSTRWTRIPWPRLRVTRLERQEEPARVLFAGHSPGPTNRPPQAFLFLPELNQAIVLVTKGMGGMGGVSKKICRAVPTASLDAPAEDKATLEALFTFVSLNESSINAKVAKMRGNIEKDKDCQAREGS